MKISLKKKSTGPNRRDLLRYTLLGTTGALAGLSISPVVNKYINSKEEKDAVPAVMIVWDSNGKQDADKNKVRNSSIVKTACKNLGLEYRMFRADADLFQCAEWERDMLAAALEFGPPCVVIVDKSGKGRCYPIPRNVDSLLKLIKEAGKE